MGEEIVLRGMVLTDTKWVSLQFNMVKVNMTARAVGICHAYDKARCHDLVGGIAAIDTGEKGKDFIGSIASVHVKPLRAGAGKGIGAQGQGLAEWHRSVGHNFPMRERLVRAG